ncbi:MAG TPA: oxygenase MpaB family protein [Myxococcaceae bacterium]
MPPPMLSHAFLDAMRLEGDPLADTLLQQVAAQGGMRAVHGLMRLLMMQVGGTGRDVPPSVYEYLARAARQVPVLDRQRIHRAEKLFALYRAEIRMILGTYSLPNAYAAGKGVQTLYRTAYLLKSPVRRLNETTEYVEAMMAPGALVPGGRGHQMIQKVRLLHAISRYHLTHDPARPWDTPGLGVPINQEDMAGTLMTFCCVVLEGLDALNLPVSRQEREDWTYVWSVVGRGLGVDERLLPSHYAEAMALTRFIRDRQMLPSPEGTAMTASLLEGLRTFVPWSVIDGLPVSLVRFFLSEEKVGGQNLADMLQVPQADWTAVLPVALKQFNGFVNKVDARSQRMGWLLRRARFKVAQYLVVHKPHARKVPVALERERGAGVPSVPSLQKQVA